MCADGDPSAALPGAQGFFPPAPLVASLGRQALRLEPVTPLQSSVEAHWILSVQIVRHWMTVDSFFAQTAPLSHSDVSPSFVHGSPILPAPPQAKEPAAPVRRRSATIRRAKEWCMEAV